uniref:Transmembrane ascorbate-dependent reductase CYB561 n=1 Tax=Poecilia latipinna TaxID=48699 RepID=A0A3B3U6X7_9TELE
LPIHVFCGLTLLVMAIGTSLLGITEKLLDTYSLFAPEGVLANMLGILLLFYGVLLVYLITREEYRRPPNPEEESLSVHFKNLTEDKTRPGFVSSFTAKVGFLTLYSDANAAAERQTLTAIDSLHFHSPESKSVDGEREVLTTLLSIRIA